MLGLAQADQRVVIKYAICVVGLPRSQELTVKGVHVTRQRSIRAHAR